ncbi:rhomboid family intramembrane serine protease [Allonocardiopsis opalescens]|uniref:Membrane associated rhomboid family serine protease n=1 Tax=Allonocardiopsis opalescens TaxID=1144618 RepID=A0A2T0Q6Z4_9ACTN|nr:rhomboid family intramembrane serine protease [Allonocardiopsis opalescens]PRX99600.1 membrane associated rhomboid family serine protease [Allonocardiopsis opalescens]
MSSESPESPSGVEQVPTCYRHPDRETYVRCSRCEKYICPDCMREAAVGFQCVECVRAGNRGVREARTTFGGRVTTAAYGTWVLLGVMVAVFVAQTFAPAVVNGFDWFSMELGLWRPGVDGGEWYRLITATFLHVDFMHLLFNGLALFIMGPRLEQLLGLSRYLALFLVSAYGGSVLTLWVAAPSTLTMGASGAIFGLFGAIFVIGRRLHLNISWIVGLLAINLAITFLVPGISWSAHIGGLVTGVLLALAFAYAPRRHRTAVHIGAVAGLTVLLTVLALLEPLVLGTAV